MGGSKRGRKSKNKEKQKSKTSDASNKNPEIPCTELHAGQKSNNDFGGPKDTEGKNLQVNTKNSMPTSRSNYTYNELEEMLEMRLLDLYDKAESLLLSYGYSEVEVKRAILKNGHVGGLNKPLDNILTNTLAVLENKFAPEREGFKGIFDLCEQMLEALVDYTMRSLPNIQRSDAVWRLLHCNLGYVPSTTAASRHQAGDQSVSPSNDQLTIEESLSQLHINSPSKMVGISTSLNLTPELTRVFKRRVPLIAAAIRQKMGLPDKEQASFGPSPAECSDDGEADFSTSETSCFDKDYLDGLIESNADDPSIIDLLESIGDLEEEIKETREWAQKKVVEAAKKVSGHLLELRALRMEKVYKRCIQSEKDAVEKAGILKLTETEQILRKTQFQVNAIHEAVRKLEDENAQIRTNIESSRLNASATTGKLKKIEKSEKNLSRKLADLGKQNSHLLAQCAERKKEMLRLENDLLHAEKETEEAEVGYLLSDV